MKMNKRTRKSLILRDSDKKPIGIVVLSWGKSLRYQFAVRNPVDAVALAPKFDRDGNCTGLWSKQVAFDNNHSRQLALGRLLEDPIKVSLPYSIAQYDDVDFFEIVMDDLANRSSVPSRARKAAKLWLQNH
jgi:hypothetical protein